jgi:hypothetical protein
MTTNAARTDEEVLRHQRRTLQEARTFPMGSPERAAAVRESIEVDVKIMLDLVTARYADETGGHVVGVQVVFDENGLVSGVLLTTAD